MSTTFKTLILTSGMMSFAAVESAAAEYQCRKNDSALRIAIEVKKAGHTLPCEVVVEDDRGERAVLFSARFDRSYCPSRIEKTRDELEQDGWACQRTSDENVVRSESGSTDVANEQAAIVEESDATSGGAPAARQGNVITASHQCRKRGGVRSIHIEVEDPARGKPCELIYWADGDQTKPGQPLWRAEHDAAFCPSRLDFLLQKWESEGWQCETNGLQEAAATISPEPEPAAEQTLAAAVEESDEGEQADLSEDDPNLEAIITADAERIGEWMEVEPAIEIAARGDLNDDGSDDAVVFLAYQSDQAAYRQYLMSYLLADNGYQLASVKLLTGVNPPPAQARVEQIDQGVIWLSLPDQDGSARKRSGFRLQNQQLVEVAPQNGVDANN